MGEMSRVTKILLWKNGPEIAETCDKNIAHWKWAYAFT
jgi:hypothetical protein